MRMIAVDMMIMIGCRSNLEWVYIGPVLLLLATNMFFLVSIFTVVGILILTL